MIISANQAVGNYWFRAVPETACVGSKSYINGSAIFRYETAPTTDPSTKTTVPKPSNCNDETQLVPWSQFATTVPSTEFISQAQHLSVDNGNGVATNHQNVVKWGVNTSAIDVDWDTPILSHVRDGDSNYKSTDNLLYVNETIVSVAHPDVYKTLRLNRFTVDVLDHPKSTNQCQRHSSHASTWS